MRLFLSCAYAAPPAHTRPARSCLILVTSVSWFRNRFYQIFLVSHVAGWISLVVALNFHVPDLARPYTVFVLVVYGVDLLCRFTKTRFGSASIASLPGGTVMVQSHQLSTGWRAGQHVWLRVPSAAGLHRSWETHPFTIANAPIECSPLECVPSCPLGRHDRRVLTRRCDAPQWLARPDAARQGHRRLDAQARVACSHDCQPERGARHQVCDRGWVRLCLACINTRRLTAFAHPRRSLRRLDVHRVRRRVRRRARRRRERHHVLRLDPRRTRPPRDAGAYLGAQRDARLDGQGPRAARELPGVPDGPGRGREGQDVPRAARAAAPCVSPLSLPCATRGFRFAS